MARLLTDKEKPVVAGGEPGFELAGWIDTAPFEDLLGLKIESAAAGRARLTMPFCLKHAQGGGLLHGGALTTLADTAVAMAIKSLLPPGTRFATIDLSLEFKRPVHEGIVRAEAVVEGPRERDFFGRAELFDQQDRLVATFASTFRVARGESLGDAG